MRNSLKLSASGVIAALGLAAAATAQPKVDRPRPQADSTDQRSTRGNQMSGMMTMMNDPEMREQMREMMRNCSRMMQAQQDNASAS